MRIDSFGCGFFLLRLGLGFVDRVLALGGESTRFRGLGARRSCQGGGVYLLGCRRSSLASMRGRDPGTWISARETRRPSNGARRPSNDRHFIGVSRNSDFFLLQVPELSLAVDVYAGG